jgi:hypothetical protein
MAELKYLFKSNKKLACLMMGHWGGLSQRPKSMFAGEIGLMFLKGKQPTSL